MMSSPIVTCTSSVVTSAIDRKTLGSLRYDELSDTAASVMTISKPRLSIDSIKALLMRSSSSSAVTASSHAPAFSYTMVVKTTGSGAAVGLNVG